MASSTTISAVILCAAMLVCDLDQLPDDVQCATPACRKPGVIFNKATRPIIIESGVLRHRQRFQFRRGQRVLTPEVFGDAQYAVVKGKQPAVPVCAGLLYILQIQHVRASRDGCTSSGLDQSCLPT